MICHQTGRAEEAVELLRRAIKLDPNSVALFGNLGIILAGLKQFAEAAKAFGQAIALKPNKPELHNNLGNVLNESGRRQEAIAAYEAALRLDPKHAAAYYNLGNALGELGRFDEAVQALTKAVALRPNADAFCSLGNALRDAGKLDEAIAAFEHSLALRPDFAAALNGLGSVYQVNGELPDAIRAYRRASEIGGFPGLGENLLVLLHLDPQSDPKSIFEEHARWNQKHTAALAREAGGYSNDPSVDRRLRIGLVSAYFDQHPVGRFLLPLIANHDRTKFEMICYSDTRTSDAMTQTLRGLSDGWRDTLNLSDEQLSRIIRSDRIDILIDLGMHTRGNRMFAFARKPAPVQVTYLAYCSTTGLGTIDYRLSDEFLDPDDSKQQFYSERTVRLGSYWCYSAPPPLPAPGLPGEGSQGKRVEGSVNFGCLNDFSKISDLSLSVWEQILAAVPNSRLIVHALEGAHRLRVMGKAFFAGVHPSRIEFVGRLPMAEYFRQYHRIDIALDPTPWPGGTTTCDALWMGVPVVSMIGKTAVSRGGLSILSHIGHPELVAGDPVEYVQIATSLARDTTRQAELRQTLREAMLHSPLMDAVGFTRDFESCLRSMWRRSTQETR